ncbi:MAG: hypothetical protein EVA89_00505 [Sandaracinaceae bacterium]|nr:MAG: hypothetical protein EVA89_00505 [Sandaracinaceae bacterium]
MTWRDGERGAPPVVCGVQALNGLGFNSHQTWALRRADFRALAESPFVLPSGKRLTMAHIRVLPEQEYGAHRLSLILRQVLGAWPDWLRGRLPRGRLAVALALPERYSKQVEHRRFAREREQLRQTLLTALEPVGHEPRLDVHAYGHGGPAYSFQWAGDLVATGEADAAMILGLDSYYDPDVVDLLADQRRLYDGDRVDGFIPGEGGAMVVLGTRRLASEAGLPVLAQLSSASVGSEVRNSYTGPNLGEGLADTVCAVTEDIAARKDSVDWWLGDVSSESYRIKEFQLAFPRFSAGVSHGASLMEFIPSHLGDMGAATLPTAVALVTEAFSRGDPLARNCLAWASSDGSTRGAILLEHPHGST